MHLPKITRRKLARDSHSQAVGAYRVSAASPRDCFASSFCLRHSCFDLLKLNYWVTTPCYIMNLSLPASLLFFFLFLCLGTHRFWVCVTHWQRITVWASGKVRVGPHCAKGKETWQEELPAECIWGDLIVTFFRGSCLSTRQQAAGSSGCLERPLLLSLIIYKLHNKAGTMALLLCQ